MAESQSENVEILSRSPEEGARRLALFYLDQAATTLPRLHDPADPEALHDLRVALRRLRSCLKSYQAHLGKSVPRKLARRLRRLADATGPGRDAEVQISWLRQRAGDIGRLHWSRRNGLTWLLARLEARLADAYADLRGELARDFPPFEDTLRGRLSVYRAEVRLDDGRQPSFGDAAAGLLRDHAAKLQRQLRRVESAGDVEEAHQARISAKRLRYLADPLSQMVETATRLDAAGEPERHARPRGASQLVQRLKGLQELLGELHDAHVLEAELGAALGEAAAQRASRLLELTLPGGEEDARLLQAERRRAPEPGLLALARLNRDRRDRLFAEFAGRWQGERGEQLLRSAEQLAEALRAAGSLDEMAAAAAGSSADGRGRGDGGEGGGRGDQ